jgi:hypothetical protein
MEVLIIEIRQLKQPPFIFKLLEGDSEGVQRNETPRTPVNSPLQKALYRRQNIVSAKISQRYFQKALFRSLQQHTVIQ